MTLTMTLTLEGVDLMPFEVKGCPRAEFDSGSHLSFGPFPRGWPLACLLPHPASLFPVGLCVVLCLLWSLTCMGPGPSCGPTVLL